MIHIMQPGLQTTLQDLGRNGHSSLGIARCGALDTNALSVANMLVNNNQQEAAIEVAVGPFEIRADKNILLGISGNGFDLSITSAGKQPNTIYSNRSLLLEANDTLLIKNTGSSGRLYIAVAGGFNIDAVLDSTSTDLYSGFGGFNGRSLQQGDKLTCWPANNNASNTQQLRIAAPNYQVRAIQGPEYTMLSEDAKLQFWQTRWQLDSNSNRMAARLNAKPLTFADDAATELLSHAVFPGIVQLPRAGKPLVLLADAQTTGGYPRIAAVIEADLWQFAQMPAGSYFTFVPCSMTQALHAQKVRNQKIAQLKQSLQNSACH